MAVDDTRYRLNDIEAGRMCYRDQSFPKPLLSTLGLLLPPSSSASAVSISARLRPLHAFLAVVVFLLLCGPLSVLAQDFGWARRAGGIDNDLGLGIATDGAGTSYVIGRFRGATTFGPGEANETTLTSQGLDDIFVASYDPTGALLWARRAGGTTSDVGIGIATDGTGNSYVTGHFSRSAIFGPGEANEAILTSDGSKDIFVASYDEDGRLRWARRAGGTSSSDLGIGIATDGTGNSYVTGEFARSATFGPGEANEITLLSAGSRNVFVAKYAPTGALRWVTRAGGTGVASGRGIATDGTGSSFVTGFFGGSATFGPGEANETTLTSQGFTDVFVARYDPTGTLLWARCAGGTEFDNGLGIATDGTGDSYVTGFFGGSATFGPGEANETTLSSDGFDMFVARYDRTGALRWARRAGGTFSDVGHGIATDGTGTSYLTGHFWGTATFGPGEANETTLTGAGLRDIFVATYDATGALRWARRAGGTSVDLARGIATDGTGTSYVTGYFTGSATFGPGETNETMLSSAGGQDIFIARYLPFVSIAIDIIPGDDPNTINCDNDRQVIPVAILTTDVFDATTVDHTTVRFAGAGEMHVDRRTGQPRRHEEDVDGDGDTDLVFHVRLGDTDLTCAATEGTLTGETFDGQPLEGSDALRIIEGGPGPRSVSDADGAVAGGLMGNYPNPFNARTEIHFRLPESAHVRLVVFDVMGRAVARLVDESLPPGVHRVLWRAEDLPSGIYLYRIEAGSLVATRRMTLLK